MGGLNYKLLVCGPAGAGKTTLVERISYDYSSSSFDVRTLVVDFLRRTRNEKLMGDELKPFYDDLIANLCGSEVDILEIANDWPELFLERIISVFFRNSNRRMLYVDASLETCLERVKVREYPTPESTVRRQHEHSSTFYQSEADRRGIPILCVSGERNFEREYAKVRLFLDKE